MCRCALHQGLPHRDRYPDVHQEDRDGQRPRKREDHLRAEHPRLLVREGLSGRGALRRLLRLHGVATQADRHRASLQRFATETATADTTSARAAAAFRDRRSDRRRPRAHRWGPRIARVRRNHSRNRATKRPSFEKSALPGGLNTTGVAPYKLHAEDALREVAFVNSFGVEIDTGVEVGKADGSGAISASRVLADVRRRVPRDRSGRGHKAQRSKERRCPASTAPPRGSSR